MIGRRGFMALLSMVPHLHTKLPAAGGIVPLKEIKAAAAVSVRDNHPTAAEAGETWWEEEWQKLLNPRYLEERFAKYRLVTQFYGELDPDLAAMKSFSAVTKKRLQMERNFARQINQERFEAYKEVLWRRKQPNGKR